MLEYFACGIIISTKALFDVCHCSSALHTATCMQIVFIILLWKFFITHSTSVRLCVVRCCVCAMIMAVTLHVHACCPCAGHHRDIRVWEGVHCEFGGRCVLFLSFFFVLFICHFSGINACKFWMGLRPHFDLDWIELKPIYSIVLHIQRQFLVNFSGKQSAIYHLVNDWGNWKSALVNWTFVIIGPKSKMMIKTATKW